MLMLFLLATHPAGALFAVLACGLLLSVPCLLREPPLIRGLFMLMTSVAFISAAALAMVPPIRNPRARIAYLFTWAGQQCFVRFERRLDRKALIHFLIATAVFALTIGLTKAASAKPGLLILRWIGGGILILAFAEMLTAALPLVGAVFGTTIPTLMRSPYLSTSITEFWTRRWNIFTSEKIFRAYVFDPLKHRAGPCSAMFAAFALSGVIHFLLAWMALERWCISLLWLAFFVVQPLFILAERGMQLRRWHTPARRVWTLSALAVSSPLFVEPALQIIAPSWGSTWQVVTPTLVVTGFLILLSSVLSLASLASHRSK